MAKKLSLTEQLEELQNAADQPFILPKISFISYF